MSALAFSSASFSSTIFCLTSLEKKVNYISFGNTDVKFMSFEFRRDYIYMTLLIHRTGKDGDWYIYP